MLCERCGKEIEEPFGAVGDCVGYVGKWTHTHKGICLYYTTLDEIDANIATYEKFLKEAKILGSVFVRTYELLIHGQKECRKELLENFQKAINKYYRG